ncbi:NAD(P)-dependent alcohol dehydrogenase [Paenibacillus sp. sptzw28]|uniref:NAD(P)-dependent alcohol dehydrogenase n=1 Tax=Paenibacillus sp. sptzw28 TaxID=715179 RepID=UPI002868D788|nr:NAD(P)-dependent alcohol dehydrogenase [Paenibacillus sp. sptzw28]
MGTFAVQIAKSFGTCVTGVDTTRKLDMLQSIGADRVIDYTQDDFTNNGQSYDLILDVAGYRSIFDYKRALSPGGTYVMVGGSMARICQLMLLGPCVSMAGSKKMGILVHRTNKNDQNFFKELFEAGKVVPVIDRRYPLSEVAEALRYLGEGHPKGKVVINMEML